jgi:hypothetical protein
MMAQTNPSITLPMPDLSLRIVITKPNGYRIRMAMLTCVLWVAGRVAPSNIDMDVEIVAKA